MNSPVPGDSPPARTGFLDRVIEVEGAIHRYKVYLPRGYPGGRSWPVILALHGAGERGSDGLKQIQVGLGAALARHGASYPAIVVFPQAPEGSAWRGGPARVAMATLDAAVAEFRADPRRIYLTGLSLGGNGCWYLGFNHPTRFAAMVVVCGFVGEQVGVPGFVHDAADPHAVVARRLRQIPVWLVHGAADQVIPVEESRRMASALGSRCLYTELAGVGHNAWDPAYSAPELTAWLFSRRRASELS